MNPRNFFAELQRRNVYKVAVAYAIISWLLVQAGSIVLPTFEAPAWTMKLLIAALAIGFPIAVVLAWAFEITPEGIVRAEDVSPNESITRRTGRKLTTVIVVVAVFAAGMFAFQFFKPTSSSAVRNAGPTSPAPAASPPAPVISAKSIAVLPFQNMSDDKQNAYFADGVQAEILTRLAKVADLRVTSRTSVMQFRDADRRNLRGIAQQLGVAHVLEGSVQRAANRVRVTAQLIDARTDSHVWAERYDGELADVFGIQTEIAQKIVGQLKAALSPKEQAALQSKPTQDTVAYDLYLRAREIDADWRDVTQEQVRLLDEAVARDPAFVPALCMLAQVHLEANWGSEDPTPTRLELARKAIEAAARLRPDAGEVHLARALFVWNFGWVNRDYAPVLAELAEARRSLPNDAEVLTLIGEIERRQGRLEESTGTMERALMLDPRNVDTAIGLDNNYRALRRYDDARRIWDSFLAWKPEDIRFQLKVAWGDYSEKADLGRLQRILSGNVPTTTADVAGQRLWLALFQRDYRAAEQALSEYRTPNFWRRGYYEGHIAQRLGDAPRAEAAFLRARERAVATLAARPDKAYALMLLARIDAKLGRKEEAVRGAERAVELLPVAKDAYDGPDMLRDLAIVYAEVGETDRALDVLQQAVALPWGPRYGSLQLDDDFDPLRKDPRFQKILASVAPQSSSR